MSKIYPAEKRCSSQDLFWKEKERVVDDDGDGFQHQRRNPCMLTVWKRSSMTFQGTDGFTVFDPHGRLVFRVDNYSRKNRYAGGGLVLMDGVGNALLTLKPQMLSMHFQWNAYKGEDVYGKNPKMKIFSMRSTSMFFNTGKDVAEIFMGGLTRQGQTPDFRIEGSFRARDCKIKTLNGELAAKMARKE
ncbi:hypothetical protein GH714_019488 [Hevea brasiliensis]|uniref:Uncharacterized protein n=1 Tax=Hevea brasiliensis TaxID=3981 RepID=A0A6A6M2Q1_HEVBR|nr:hypothetical protein GH714_019488 [Hevea brasiliensis]